MPARAAPATAAPTVASGGGFGSDIMGTIAQGIAFGTGYTIAHRAVGAVAGGMGDTAEPECSTYQTEFVKCLSGHKDDLSYCQTKFDGLERCRFVGGTME